MYRIFYLLKGDSQADFARASAVAEESLMSIRTAALATTNVEPPYLGLVNVIRIFIITHIRKRIYIYIHV